MKSKISCLVNGDKNTKFYHTSMIYRRKHNRIAGLSNNVGNWISDERGFAEHIRKGILDRFSSSMVST